MFILEINLKQVSYDCIKTALETSHSTFHSVPFRHYVGGFLCLCQNIPSVL